MHQDEDLDKLEEDIRLLKFRYDQFFGGFSKLPPLQDRRQIEAAIHELGRQKMRDNSRRFRYNTLLTRFNQFREMWARKMREREEGPLDFRRRQAAMAAAGERRAAAAQAPPTAEVTSRRPDPYVRVDSASNGEAVSIIYEQIENEHLKLGRQPAVTREQVGAMIQQQTEALRARYNVQSVAFRVETIDGKVKLKAKPLQDKR